jgi:hypothetical protein
MEASSLTQYIPMAYRIADYKQQVENTVKNPYCRTIDRRIMNHNAFIHQWMVYSINTVAFFRVLGLYKKYKTGLMTPMQEIRHLSFLALFMMGANYLALSRF